MDFSLFESTGKWYNQSAIKRIEEEKHERTFGIRGTRKKTA